MAGGVTFAAEGGAGPSLSSLAPPDLHGLQSLHSSLQNVSATLPSDPTLQQLLRGGPAGGAAAAFSPAAALGLAPLPGAGGGGGLGMLAQLQGASRDSQQWSPEAEMQRRCSGDRAEMQRRSSGEGDGAEREREI